MKVRIEWNDLRAIGATAAQLETYSNSDPLEIFQIGADVYKVSGIVEEETDAQGVLDSLDALREAEE